MNAKVTAILAIVGVSIVLSFLLSFPAMLLWNYCLVPAVGVAEVGWLQMWGITILANLLLKTHVSFNKD